MNKEEYERFWPIFYNRLTDEEKEFWAMTTALNTEGARRTSDRWEKEALKWRRIAIFFAAINIAFIVF